MSIRNRYIKHVHKRRHKMGDFISASSIYCLAEFQARMRREWSEVFVSIRFPSTFISIFTSQYGHSVSKSVHSRVKLPQ